MSEMFDTINAQAEQAKAQENAQAVREAEALAEWRREQLIRRKAAQREADARIGVKALFYGVTLWGLMAASDAGLIDPSLAGGVLLFGSMYFMFHVGAWWQARFVKGGVLHGSK